jgi:hypothetical protein
MARFIPAAGGQRKVFGPPIAQKIKHLPLVQLGLLDHIDSTRMTLGTL